MRIGLVGATGPAGSALAVRLASVGHDVVLGSRSKYRAMEVCDRLLERWSGRELTLGPGDNVEAVQTEIVVIATPWDAAAGTAVGLAEHLAGKVVICMSNALQKVGHEFQPLVPPRGSVSASVQAAVRDAFVAAAFHHVPARELGDLDTHPESDVLVCSDHLLATEVAMDIVNTIPGLRALDAGELSNATAIEAFTAVLLQLNVRYKTRAAIRFTGIDL
jgi:NADPH-dependent F420 reductase